MIPKIIHYCWLSNEPYPELIIKCMDSWKRILIDYEFVLWDTKRFDIHSIPYVYEAYRAKKYAFAADYIRLYALYHHGGIYLDTDVEVIKTFDELLKLPYFIGLENPENTAGNPRLEVAAFGSEKGAPWIMQFLESYSTRRFMRSPGNYNQEILPIALQRHISELYNVKEINNIDDFDFNTDIFNVLPYSFFSPKNIKKSTYTISNDTYCVHHYNSEWAKNKNNIQIIREKISNFIKNTNLYK